MAQPKRCELRCAIHLVTAAGYSGGHVFYDPQLFKRFPENPRRHAPDAEYLERLLWDTCEQYDARVHGYIIEPNVVLAVIQTLRAPLRWIMHDVLARYAMHLVEHNRTPAGIRPFPRRYKEQIVQPSKLPYAVRYVQRRANTGDQTHRAVNHPFSSSLIYCGRRPRPTCFVVSGTRERLRNLGHVGTAAYFEFMAHSDSPAIADLLSRPVVGEREFVESVRAGCSETPYGPCADEILQEVASCLLHTDPSIVCSSTHQGALARALVAWYAMRTGAAQIATVSRWFGVTSSNLRYLIREHRRKSPHYFSRSLSELFPALSVPDAGHAQCPASRSGLPPRRSQSMSVTTRPVS